MRYKVHVRHVGTVADLDALASAEGIGADEIALVTDDQDVREVHKETTMRIIVDRFKESMRNVRAGGRGGIYDKQLVMLRTEYDSLIVIGVGGEADVGLTKIPIRYTDEEWIAVVSLVGLRNMARCLGPHDTLDMERTDEGMRFTIESYKPRGKRLERGLVAEYTLADRSVR